MLPTDLLIATDLDGTLLGHENYAYEPVIPVMKEFKAAGVPVVLATSKTRAEVEQWQRKLGLSQPFIVENGSAVVMPDGEVEVLGAELAELESFLTPFEALITSFVQCPLAEAISLTGLTEAEAKLARNRHYSVPFVLQHEDIEAEIRDAAEKAGFSVLRGGRFLHLQGRCDKHLALQRVCQQLNDQAGVIHRVIALGDNQNDEEMLENADVAVVVNQSGGQPMRLQNPRTIYTEATAPEGWIEGVRRALALIEE